MAAGAEVVPVKQRALAVRATPGVGLWAHTRGPTRTDDVAEAMGAQVPSRRLDAVACAAVQNERLALVCG